MKENCRIDKKQHITDAEWEVMRVVWANSEVTSKFVASKICVCCSTFPGSPAFAPIGTSGATALGVPF